MVDIYIYFFLEYTVYVLKSHHTLGGKKNKKDLELFIYLGTKKKCNLN